MLKYNIDGITEEQIKNILLEGSEFEENWLCGLADGTIFLSNNKDDQNREDLAFYFETFYIGTWLVGPSVADKKEFIRRLVSIMKLNWIDGKAKEKYLHYT